MAVKFLLAALIMLISGTAVPAQTPAGESVIRVRVLSAIDGTPLPKLRVNLVGSKNSAAGTGLTLQDTIFKLDVWTDADGWAVVTVPDRSAPMLNFVSTMRVLCGPEHRVAMALVFEKGAVIPNNCAKGEKFHWWEIKAAPRELIIFSVPYPRGF